MQIRFIALTLLLLSTGANADNFVISSTDDSGVGSLRQAILDSNAPAGGVHTLTFSAGFPTNGVILLDSSLPQILSQSLSVRGEAQHPRIDGQAQHGLFNVSSGNSILELSDMVLQNAFTEWQGACVDSGSAASIGRLKVERVLFSNCQVSESHLIQGGAIFWNRASGTLSVIDSQFLDNGVVATAENGQSFGGAIFTNANLTVSRTVFDGNSASASSGGGGGGGAIALVGDTGSSSISDSTFLSNTASPSAPTFGYGGAIWISCDNCSTQIVRSYLRGNMANYGGALYARKPSSGALDVNVALTNSTFYNSAAVNSGGSAFIGGGVSLSAANNTFYKADAGSGAHLSFAGSAEVSFFRANLLAATFAGTACAGVPTVTNPALIGFNLLADNSCASLAPDALPDSPMGTVFVDERPGSIGVLRFSGSAVIDSISTDGICEPLDARKQTRPIDGDGDGIAACDVGAYEDPHDVIFRDSFEGSSGSAAVGG